jgi:ADP-ribosylglycohydrolase/fructose-1,6-bisphosphatase/inositol monophosphatase family enzyme
MDYRGALRTATEAALAAGDLLRREFHRPGGPRGTPGHAPVDEEAERIIRQRLLAAFPDWSYRGEETGAQRGPDARHCWLVDPNDGTAVFQKGHRGSAVSIGLLCDGVPVLGVVYAFCAPDDHGDLFTWAEACGPAQRNGRPVAPAFPGRLDHHSIVLLAPGAEAVASANLAVISPARFLALPSIAYRLALAAAGEGLATVSIHSPGGWDYAGGHALLRGVGGALLDEAARPVTYSLLGDSATERCFGGDPAVVAELALRDWAGVRSAAREPRAEYDPVRLQPGRNVSDPGLLSRAQGCLLGQLAGDSLGSLVEFRSAEEIKRRYPEGARNLEDGGTFDTIAGQPTDDSELALMLARSMVQAGKYDPEAAARAYRFWYRSRPFDCGATIARALEWREQVAAKFGSPLAGTTRSARDGELEFAATGFGDAPTAESQSNGSLMRLSPLGIWGYDAPPERLADWAATDAALTHPHPLCRQAAAVYAIAIARAVATGEAPRDIYRYASEWTMGNCPEAFLRAALADAARKPPVYEHNSGWVLVAFQNAFYQLLHAASLEEGVVQTVMAGGDTDTNAAIAGALLGAVHGREALPTQWCRMVLSCRPLAGLPGVRQPRPRCFWPVDALALAERLLLHG